MSGKPVPATLERRWYVNSDSGLRQADDGLAVRKIALTFSDATGSPRILVRRMRIDVKRGSRRVPRMRENRFRHVMRQCGSLASHVNYRPRLLDKKAEQQKNGDMAKIHDG